MTRLSVRTRLTLVYGSLFLLTSAVLVAVTYWMTVQSMNAGFGMENAPTITAADLQALTGGDRVDALLDLRDRAERAMAERRADVLERLLRGSLATMAVLGIVAVAIGYVVAGRVLRPIHTVTATARRLSESTLYERIGLEGPQDEIKDLADTFDGMLDRLHRAFDAQRRFVANASHELRTPLTINRTVLEVALASRKNPPETKALADVLLGNTARHERLIDGLLLLARSEREPTAPDELDLAEVARGALGQIDRERTDLEIDARLEPGMVSGDPVLLERCVGNLLENAVKYNVPGGRVRVRTGTADGSVNGAADGAAFVRVENTGKIVPEYEVANIFEPFRRLRGDRVGSADGAGLGLSIVRAVVVSHGGSVETVPRPEGGLSITVRLPALSPR
ncbi:sensor histidine kinase [Actinomadura algeriensis]|uniref:histidine kinase n=1 Tax=Actinomadura algeriensis TaxID=1679523 RepID=A0ABR9K457_9ACTN|nr:ATP-binding protein [Actinomadura algeriensis]MBE1537623.1 signal transduction histidine kinase [Actinomadura algeriensis]